MAVEVGEVYLGAAYQPIRGMDEEGMERYRRDLESQVAIGRNARLVIGGNFNASVGIKRNVRDCVENLIWERRMMLKMIEWCKQHELQHVNSYIRYKRRGTWGHMQYAR